MPSLSSLLRKIVLIESLVNPAPRPPALEDLLTERLVALKHGRPRAILPPAIDDPNDWLLARIRWAQSAARGEIVHYPAPQSPY